MRKLISLVAAGLLVTTPAFAQFPPPGIYQCVDGTGASVGTLTLLVAGDYDFKSETLPSGTGQVASSGTSVNSISGPLADLHLTGSFSSDQRGEAVFVFDTDKGRWQCSLPPL